ncbi:MAG: hypothetical protein ACWGQW_03070 [bacterium]
MTSRGTNRGEGYMAALLWDQINRMCGEKQLSLFMRPTGWKDEETMVFCLHDNEASLKLRTEVAWIGEQGIGVKFKLGR